MTTASEARDREATKARLLQAVDDIIAEEGFSAIGMRSVARRAGVDKVLIYRYFGGLPGLLAAFADEGDFWWSVDDLLADLPQGARGRDAIASSLALVFRRHVAFLRAHPITMEVIAWEMHERNELTEALEGVREERSQQMMCRLADRLGVDRAAFLKRYGPTFALLGAATNYLSVRGRRLRVFNGIDLQTDRGWQTLMNAAAALLTGLERSSPLPRSR